MAPATFLVIIVMLAALIIGVLVLRRSLRCGGRSDADERLGTQTKCPNCQTLNATHARFCGRCGRPMH